MNHEIVLTSKDEFIGTICADCNRWKRDAIQGVWSQFFTRATFCRCSENRVTVPKLPAAHAVSV